jgi:hypothetical protein
MRELDPVYVPMMNTTTWYLDAGHVRAVQPQTGRDVILPRRFGPLWEWIEQGFDVAGVLERAATADPPYDPAEVARILETLQQLNLIKLTHPCWTEPTQE